jgi:hypothetical protein
MAAHEMFITVKIAEDGGPLVSEATVRVFLPEGEGGDRKDASVWAEEFAGSGMLGYYDSEVWPRVRRFRGRGEAPRV